MSDSEYDEDDSISEGPSDAYETRSEVSGSETVTPDELGNEAAELSQLRNVGPVGAAPQEKRPVRSITQRMNRESDPDRTYDQRGARSQTPLSEYQLAPMGLSSYPRVSKERHSSPSPGRRRSSKPDKHREARFMIKPPRFEGKDSCLESHLVKFEIVAKRNKWDEFEKADFLKCSLSGEASHLLRDLSDSASYDDVVYKLRQRYGSLEQIESFRMELKQRKRKPGESLTNLLKDIRRLFALAFPGPPNYLSELTAKDAFIDALGDRELMIKVLEREPKTLDQAFKIAERLELYRNIPGERDIDSKAKPVSKVRAAVVDDDSVFKINHRNAEVNAEAADRDHRIVVQGSFTGIQTVSKGQSSS